MFAVPLRDIVRIHSTSGTTGKPIVVGYTRNDLRNWTECTARLLAAAGVPSTTSSRSPWTTACSPGGFGFHQGAEQIGASVIPASHRQRREADRDHAGLQDHGPDLRPGPRRRASPPASPQLHVHPERLHLRLGLFGGERWSEPLRRQLEERLHIAATDTYGLTEVMGPGVAGECHAAPGPAHQRGPLHRGGHRPARPSSPLPPGQEGRAGPHDDHQGRLPADPLPDGRHDAACCPAPCACGRTFARMAAHLRPDRRPDLLPRREVSSPPRSRRS